MLELYHSPRKKRSDLHIHKQTVLYSSTGFLIYFGYGIWHSSEQQRQRQGTENAPEKQRMFVKDGTVDKYIHSEKTSQL